MIIFYFCRKQIRFRNSNSSIFVEKKFVFVPSKQINSYSFDQKNYNSLFANIQFANTNTNCTKRIFTSRDTIELTILIDDQQLPVLATSKFDAKSKFVLIFLKNM